MNAPITAQTLRDFSAKTRPFWLPVLDRLPAGPFSVKICYMANEFESPQLAARVFPFELEKTQYYELIDFSFNPMQPGFRRLHALEFRPDAKSRYPFFPNAHGGQYLVPLSEFKLLHSEESTAPLVPSAPVKAPAPVPAPAPAPAFRLTAKAQAEIADNTPPPAIVPTVAPPAPAPTPVVDFTAPEPETPAILPSPEVTPEANETHYADDEQKDESMTKMTIRDKYAIEHNVPVSNKAWVNRMIREGINYQLDLAREYHDIQAGN